MTNRERFRVCLAGALAVSLTGGCATGGPLVGKGADPVRSALVCGAAGAAGGAAIGAGLGSIGGGGKGAGQGAILGSLLGALGSAITCLLISQPDHDQPGPRADHAVQSGAAGPS